MNSPGSEESSLAGLIHAASSSICDNEFSEGKSSDAVFVNVTYLFG